MLQKRPVRLATVVALMAAIGPSMTSARADKARRPRPIGQVVSVQRISPLCQRRVEVAIVSAGGQYGNQCQEMLAAMLRSRLVDSGLVQVAISGDQLTATAETLRRIHTSGLYSRASRDEVKLAEWLAPTERWEVSFTLDVNTEGNVDAEFSVGGIPVSASASRVTVPMQMVVEIIKIGAGVQSRGVEVSVRSSKVVTTSLKIQTAGYSGQDIDGTPLVRAAFSKAIDQLIFKLRS